MGQLTTTEGIPTEEQKPEIEGPRAPELPANRTPVEKTFELVEGGVAAALGAPQLMKETACECPESVRTITERMRALATKHNNFGFGSPEALDTFLTRLGSGETQLSLDTLNTIKALKPRETQGSYLVLAQINGETYLMESAPSRKGPNGQGDAGVWITATEAGAKIRQENRMGIGTALSAENILNLLHQNGAVGLQMANKAMLEALQNLGLFSTGSTREEWLSDSAARGKAWFWQAAEGDSKEDLAYIANPFRGVRALRNVTQEVQKAA
ncbi:MAG: hypothetical protein WC777_01905 [Candidatus Gracilibacteria bacterium]|jgi:hypothetical protein